MRMQDILTLRQAKLNQVLRAIADAMLSAMYVRHRSPCSMQSKFACLGTYSMYSDTW